MPQGHGERKEHLRKCNYG